MDSIDDLRGAVSTWLTLALDINSGDVTDDDLLTLRDWIDSGCQGDMPIPGKHVHDALCVVNCPVKQAARDGEV